ncbi:MAG: T9SS type A sorting domain-containing protein [Candidatus Zixiibacteriota bacterium]|nr:MAG: T9SS type A sorting domain-containing protein [candidate division Zixibacteria bacterium]
MPNRSNIKIEIFDMLGRKLETLGSGYLDAGRHKTVWNADGNPSGVYFYKIESDGLSGTGRCLLLK